MKKPLQILIIFLVAVGQGAVVKAQNLVPNYSFEQYSQCPDNENQISYSIGWKSYYATPDYFNICATGAIASIPYNWVGSYQPPLSGSSAYAGFFAYWSGVFSGGGSNLREHIGRQLLSPLVVGVKYFVSFKVSLAASTGANANCACNNIGIKFSTVPYDLYADSSGSSPLVNNFAQIYDSTLISDTVNWTTISGSFIADSAYNYLIIANFFKDINTDTLIIFPFQNYCYSYYYVDDICVSTNSFTCITTGVNEIQLQDIVKIYPNPFSNSTTLKFNDSLHFNSYKVTLYDAMGKEIKNYEMKSSELKIERNGLPEDIYFLKILINNNSFFQKLLITN